MDRKKGSRDLRKSENFRKSRSRKTKQNINPKTMEYEESTFSAKKLKLQKEIIVPHKDF